MEGLIMTNEQHINFLQLQLRNAIASKEAVIAKANRETAMEGWTFDWSRAIEECDIEIQGIITAISSL
jgi:hypothetical protein